MSSELPSRSGSVSVVIPLYNHAKYIERAVQSVLDQTLAPAQIIVVDDGSTDDSAAGMRQLCGQHPQIIFWSQPNQGAHHAINAGIHRATGEYLSILNSDDAYYPTRLAECLAVLDGDPGACAVATGLTFIDGAGKATTSEWYDNARAYYDRTGDLSLALIRDNFFVSTSNLFVRRAVFEEIGHFSPLRYTHDLDFSLRLLACGKRVQFLDRPLLHYRIHGSNTIGEASAGINIERAAVVAFYLHTAWLQGSRDEKDWPAYLGELAEIADQRALGVVLREFLDHLDRFPAADDEGLGIWTRDAQFRRYARETLGIASAGDLVHESQRLADELRLLRDQLADRDATIAEQKTAIASLEQGRQWLDGQNASLQKELAQRETMLAEQKAWITAQDQANAQLIERTHQLQETIYRLEETIARLENELGQIEHSRGWRLLTAMGLGSRRPK